MKTCNSSNRWVRWMAAVGGVLTVSAGAHGGGQPGPDLAARINRHLKIGRVVKVEPPLQEAPVIPSSLLEAFPNANPDLFETMPVGVPIVTIEIPNNEAIEAGLVDSRGIAATGGSGEAYVFYQPNDSGFGHYVKAGDTSGYGTWSTQAILGNGFEAGMAISGYDFLMHNSSYSVNDAAWSAELWDGDPLAALDTVCNGGNPQPIPGTLATFGPLPQAPPDPSAFPWSCNTPYPICVGLYRLRAHLPEKVVINCDRVWIVVTMTEGCRAAWRITGPEGNVYDTPIGFQNGYEFFYACEQYGDCDTPSGYNAGTCCNSGTACDFTDGDPAKWTVDGVAGATCSFEPQDPHTSPVDATFCGDGVTDFVELHGNTPDEYRGYVASVYAPTNIAIQWRPKKALFKGKIGDLVEAPSEVIDNEIILYKRGVNVMLELQVNDWSGDDGLTRLKAFGAALDTRGYFSGLGGALTEKLIPCTGDAECIAAFGGFCSIFGDPCTQDTDCQLDPIETCLGSTCLELPSRLAGYCAPGYAATKRPDFCLTHTNPLGAVDVSTPEYRYGWVAQGGATEAYRDLDLSAKGLAYLGTLWIGVPDNAKGSYTVGLYPPIATALVDQNAWFIPMVGQIPAKITVLDCTGTDCQPNGIPDDCEIERGLTEDCNGNGVPDDCEPDCDGNGLADECEQDSDGDGVIDACDGCPDDPNMTSPGICGCGALNIDSDLDTVPNCVDQCPGVDDRIDLDENGTPDCVEQVPTLSAWGLVILALLLLAGGKVCFGRRRAVTL